MNKIFSFVILSYTLLYSLLEAAPFGYISNRNSDSVSVLDLASDTIIKNISVQNHPESIVMSQDRKYVYVANRWGLSISVIDCNQNEVVKTFEIPSEPKGLAITPDGRHLWLTVNENSIYIVSTDNGEVQKIITEHPNSRLAITPDGKRAFVTSVYSTEVYVFDVSNKRLIEKCEAVVDLEAIAITYDGNYALACRHAGDQSIARINTHTYSSEIITGFSGTSLEAIAVSSEDQFAYICTDNNDVFRLKLLNNEQELISTTGSGPHSIAITSNGKYAYVCNEADNTLTKIDLYSNTANTINLAGLSSPAGIVLPKFFLIDGLMDFSPIKYQR